MPTGSTRESGRATTAKSVSSYFSYMTFAFESFQFLEQLLVGGSVLDRHLSLAVDCQYFGAARPLEPSQVGLGVACEICKRPDVFWSDHGCADSIDPSTNQCTATVSYTHLTLPTKRIV